MRTADDGAVGEVVQNEQGSRSPPRRLPWFSDCLMRCPEPCTQHHSRSCQPLLLHGMRCAPESTLRMSASC